MDFDWFFFPPRTLRLLDGHKRLLYQLCTCLWRDKCTYLLVKILNVFPLLLLSKSEPCIMHLETFLHLILQSMSDANCSFLGQNLNYFFGCLVTQAGNTTLTLSLYKVSKCKWMNHAWIQQKHSSGWIQINTWCSKCWDFFFRFWFY